MKSEQYYQPQAWTALPVLGVKRVLHMSSVVLLPLCKPLRDITLPLESSRTTARAVGDARELTLAPVFEVGPILQVSEDGVALVGVRADDASTALLFLIL
jgi:hypothetical protein